MQFVDNRKLRTVIFYIIYIVWIIWTHGILFVVSFIFLLLSTYLIISLTLFQVSSSCREGHRKQSIRHLRWLRKCELSIFLVVVTFGMRKQNFVLIFLEVVNIFATSVANIYCNVRMLKKKLKYLYWNCTITSNKIGSWIVVSLNVTR